MRSREEIQKFAAELPNFTHHGEINLATTMELAIELSQVLRERNELHRRLDMAEKRAEEAETLQRMLNDNNRGIRGAINDVNQFHRAIPDSIHQDIGDQSPALTRRVMRWKLIKEEVDELNQALMENDVHAVADAYADIIYVALGSAIMHIGIERFIRVWDEVQRANMDKVSDGGKIIRREDGKILKPDGWRGPDIEKAFDLRESNSK